MDFIIDFDEIIEDMNFATRQTAINRLKRNFKENIDYEIKRDWVDRHTCGKLMGYKFYLTKECAESFVNIKTKSEFYNIYEIAGLHRIYPYQVREILDDCNIPHIKQRTNLFHDTFDILVVKKVYLEHIDKFRVQAIPPVSYKEADFDNFTDLVRSFGFTGKLTKEKFKKQLEEKGVRFYTKGKQTFYNKTDYDQLKSELT